MKPSWKRRKRWRDLPEKQAEGLGAYFLDTLRMFYFFNQSLDRD
jgi:hypothetical protein